MQAPGLSRQRGYAHQKEEITTEVRDSGRRCRAGVKRSPRSYVCRRNQTARQSRREITPRISSTHTMQYSRHRKKNWMKNGCASQCLGDWRYKTVIHSQSIGARHVCNVCPHQVVVIIGISYRLLTLALLRFTCALAPLLWARLEVNRTGRSGG